MADTTKAEDVVDNVANGESQVKNPTSTAEKDGEAPAEPVNDTKNEDSKDAAEETNDQAETNGEQEDQRTRSPDNKRKGNDDHYRDGNKRSRGDGRGGRGGRGRGGGRGGRFNNRNNIVRTFDDQPESNDPVEIRRQVEFYFSDSNLPVDGYLLSMVEGSKNLPVDLRTIHNFKRMRHFQPFTAVTEAVKHSQVLNVEEKDNTAYVTRKTPLDEKFTLDTAENKKLLTTDTMERSIYAKGFGDETKSTHLDIEEYFAPYGPINSIRLRRTDDKEFKGSVFVEFADVATQQRFLEMEEKPTWGPDDKELQIMSKQQYVERKNQDILAGNVRPKSPRQSGYSGHGSHGNKRGGRGGGFRDRRNSDKRDRSRSPGNDDWKARRDRDQRNGNRDDRKRSGRGGGRGGRGRGGRDDRKRRDRDGDAERERSGSPHRNDKNDGDDKRDDAEKMPTRAEAEAKKEHEQQQAANGAADADAGAEKADGASKKRAREDDGAGEEGVEAKKVKETAVEA